MEPATETTEPRSFEPDVEELMEALDGLERSDEKTRERIRRARERERAAPP